MVRLLPRHCSQSPVVLAEEISPSANSQDFNNSLSVHVLRTRAFTSSSDRIQRCSVPKPALGFDPYTVRLPLEMFFCPYVPT